MVFSFNGGGKEILEEDAPGFLCSGRWKIQQLPSAAVQILNKAKVPSQGWMETKLQPVLHSPSPGTQCGGYYT